MRSLSAIAVAAGLAAATPALAQQFAPSPLLGSWAVEVERLPIPPEARPKSVTFTFAEAGDGRWNSEVQIVDGSGASTKGISTYALNGVPAEVQGSPEADTVAVRLPAPSVLVMALAKGGVPGSTRVYAVAPDGKSMVETAVYFTKEGSPVMRTNYFRRVR